MPADTLTPPPSDRPILIGLTGGIASGKSSAARCFAELGVPLVDADQIARELVEPGQPALAEILYIFGPEAGDMETGLNREYLRSRVFSDDEARKQLESVLHPEIRAKMFDRALSFTHHYVVLEIPLLVENGLGGYVDRVLVIDCRVETQIARVQARDGSEPEVIQGLIDAQASREDRLAAAHDVVSNESDLDTLTHCIHQIHEVYSSLGLEDIAHYPSIRLP